MFACYGKTFPGTDTTKLNNYNILLFPKANIFSIIQELATSYPLSSLCLFHSYLQCFCQCFNSHWALYKNNRWSLRFTGLRLVIKKTKPKNLRKQDEETRDSTGKFHLYYILNRIILLYVFVANLVMLGTYSWHCAQEWLLVELWVPDIVHWIELGVRPFARQVAYLLYFISSF